MLFAFYFFLRKNELRLAQQVRFLASETALDGFATLRLKYDLQVVE